MSGNLRERDKGIQQSYSCSNLLHVGNLCDTRVQEGNKSSREEPVQRAKNQDLGNRLSSQPQHNTRQAGEESRRDEKIEPADTIGYVGWSNATKNTTGIHDREDIE